jgi:hypothetical protein
MMLKRHLTALLLLAAVAAPVSAADTWEYNRGTSGIKEGATTQINRIYKDESSEVNVFRVANKRLYEDYKFTKDIDPYDRAIWDMFLAVAGSDAAYRNVSAYATFRLGKEPVLAYVGMHQKKDPMWHLVVNANNANLGNPQWKKDMAITLIHEYAHLLSLGKKQMDLGRGEIKCKKTGTIYIEGYGCSKKKSYIQAFGKRFWTAEDVEEAYESQEEHSSLFYKRHEGEFVTQYAATNITEDFAESFTDFILRAKPPGTNVAEQKVLFFYRYPELVKMRAEMRDRIDTYFGH